MARTVSLLTDAALVEQRRHPTDGRKLVITATDSGIRALHDQRARREGSIAAAITDRLTPAEQRQLRDAVPLLAKLSH